MDRSEKLGGCQIWRARGPRDISVFGNDAAWKQSIHSIHGNSCSMTCCPILLEHCVFIHWKTGELWRKKILNHELTVTAFPLFLLPTLRTTPSLFEHEEAFHEVREGLFTKPVSEVLFIYKTREVEMRLVAHPQVVH